MSSVFAEHVDYLSLTGRTDRFAEALARVVEPGDVVADLGCGVGVLGLLALRAGAARVYGIDYSDAIEIARETMAREGLADRYSCIRGSTFRTSLPEQADMIICDHVGFFGFDYGIVAMMQDARRRMLKPGGKVMPQGIRLMLAGVQSARCRAMADAWKCDPVPPPYHWVHEQAVNARFRHAFDAEDICAPPVELGLIDLRVDCPDSMAFDATLTAQRDCTLDGLAGWFECELADGVWMTNSPLEEGALERPGVFLACATPVVLRQGEEVAISLRLRHEDATIAWTVTPPAGPRQKLSTWLARIISPADLVAKGDAALALSPTGRARRIVLDLVDGQRTAGQIADAVCAAHPGLYPSEDEIRRFVERELQAATQAGEAS